MFLNPDFFQSDTMGNDTFEKKQTYRRTDHYVRRVGQGYIIVLLLRSVESGGITQRMNALNETHH